MKKKPFIIAVLASLVAFGAAAFGKAEPAQAKSSITVSPMYQTKVLVAGKSEPMSFDVSNPASSDETLNYEVTVSPFWLDNENQIDFSDHEDYSQIINWITIDEPTGSVEPNEIKSITFTINVPEDAPTGGQYASIRVRNVSDANNGMISESFEMAHLVYAEVAGSVTRDGEIMGVELPSFMFSGNVVGSATVKNTGNVHSNVVHTLVIRPLFGDNKLFSNEDAPQENLIMPGGTRYTNVTWENTPSMGVFRAVYTVEYEGVKKELSKIIVICPLWLLVVIAIGVAVIILLVVTKLRKIYRA